MLEPRKASPWRRFIAIDLLAAIVSALLIVALYRVRQPTVVLRIFFHTMACANIIGVPIAITLTRFGRWMYLHPPSWNWILIAGDILGCTVVGSLAANLLFLAVGLPPASGFWNSFWLVTEFATVIALIFGLSAFAYEVLGTVLHTTQLAEERARKYALEAQLASLESHIRPHFLFNALNTISSLIHDDPALAESLIGKLAALLRFSLDSNQQRLAPLASELKIVMDYLEIERARFGDRLRYYVEVPLEMQSAEVPALSLQTLVENSVRHGIAHRAEGGLIHITARAENGIVRVEVFDDGPGFTKDAIKPGHGLDNLQGRLDALFGVDAKLEIDQRSSHTSVCLLLPRAT